jgi:hypothetical protein
MLNDFAGIRMGISEMCSFDFGYLQETAVVNMLMNIYVPNILEILFY